MPQRERGPFLEAACSGAPELHSQVQELLRCAEDAGSFLEGSPLSGLERIPGVTAEQLIGTYLGAYRIDEKIGEGGMGVVFRATDTKLHRPVAVKLLYDELATAASRRRFQLEAQMASSLNHPHILTVHDAGEFEGRQYLVTEYMDGGTLAEWPSQRRPWRQVVERLIGVADGLAAAHEAHILHRDIKPGNILLSKSGYAKLADFGLAKLAEPVLSDSTATVTALTHAGAILGTPAYMSPEQASGEPLDQRSDIFSFGMVLYELLAGAQPFQGGMVEVLAAIRNKPVPALPPEIPYALRSIVEKALEKDPADRFQNMRDVVVDLKRVLRQPSGEQVAQAGRHGSSARAPLTERASITVIGILLLASAGLGGWVARRFWPPASAPLWRGARLGGTEISVNPRISPDGHTLAFVAIMPGESHPAQVAVMKPETGNMAVLTHRLDGWINVVSWSADGNQIYYDRVTDVPRGVFSVPALGGDERLVLEDAAAPEALPDGSLLLQRQDKTQAWRLFRFWPDSGKLQAYPLASSAFDFFSHRVLPGGRQAVVLGSFGQSGRRLYVLDLESGKARRLNSGLDDSQFHEGLAVSRDGKTVLAEFMAQELVRIVSIPVDGHAAASTMFTVSDPAWSMDTAPDGSIYLDQVSRPVHLIRFSPAGHAEAFASVDIPQISVQTHTFALLPDGRAVVPEVGAGRQRLMLLEDGKQPSALVNTSEETRSPLTALGEGEVAFLIGPQDRPDIATASVATGRITRRIPFAQGPIMALAASSDGSTLYATAEQSVWRVPVAGGEPKKLAAGFLLVNAWPGGSSLLGWRVETPLTRLFRFAAAGGNPEEVKIRGPLRIFANVNANAVGKDGRILAMLATNSWDQHLGIVDPVSGQVNPVPIDYVTDVHSAGWTVDGHIVALGFDLRSTVWKFEQEKR